MRANGARAGAWKVWCAKDYLKTKRLTQVGRSSAVEARAGLIAPLTLDSDTMADPRDRELEEKVDGIKRALGPSPNSPSVQTSDAHGVEFIGDFRPSTTSSRSGSRTSASQSQVRISFSGALPNLASTTLGNVESFDTTEELLSNCTDPPPLLLSQRTSLLDDDDGLIDLEPKPRSKRPAKDGKRKSKGKSKDERKERGFSPFGASDDDGPSSDKENDDKDDEPDENMLIQPLKEGAKDKTWGKPSAAGFRRIMALGWPEKWKIIGASIGLVGYSLGNLALPQLVGGLMDTMAGVQGHPDSSTKAMEAIRILITKLAVIFAIIAVSSWIRATLFAIAGEKIVARLRRSLYDKLLTMEVAFYDVNRTGELVNRLASDTTLIQNTVTTSLSSFLRALGLVIGGLAVLFSISWKLTMVMFVILPILGAIAFGYGKFIRTLSKKVQDALANATTVAEETFGSIRTVKSFGAEGKEGERYAERVSDSYAIAKRRAWIDGAFEAAVGLIINCCLGGILYFGGYLVIKGEITAGTLTSFVLYCLQTAAGFMTLSSLFGDFMRAMGASERVFELLDREPTVKFEGGDMPLTFRGNVEFKDVHFTYPSRLDRPVLQGLNLNLRPGRTLALVGPSGGGKSTIGHLLLGLYTPGTGSIQFDGVDSQSLDPAFLRQHIAVVSQEPTLFATTIRDNICYGVSDADDIIDSDTYSPQVPTYGEREDTDIDMQGVHKEKTAKRYIQTGLRRHRVGEMVFMSADDKQRQVEEAAKMANAHDFIMSFPDGYDTMVGERGIRLSGGQKQRIAIARALLKNPKILILDEATSALDSESEHLVKEALDELLRQSRAKADVMDGSSERAYLVIAHRLSTVKNADEVAVVLDGKIAERGTHDELLQLNGVYKTLVSRQLSQD